MTKEEIIKKLKEINDNHSPEERVKLLKELKNIIKSTNNELSKLYISAKEELDKQAHANISANIASS